VPLAEPVVEAAPAAPPAPAVITCAACGTVNPLSKICCDDCGYYFSDADIAAAQRAASGSAEPAATAASTAPPTWLQERFAVGTRISERFGVERLNGLDHGD